MDFGDVIKRFNEEIVEGLDKGYAMRFARAGWNGKGMWIEVCIPVRCKALDETGCETELEMQPFIVMKTAQGTLVPWLASQTDMLADDWEVVQ